MDLKLNQKTVGVWHEGTKKTKIKMRGSKSKSWRTMSRKNCRTFGRQKRVHKITWAFINLKKMDKVARKTG